MTTDYAHGTCLITRMPCSTFVGGKAMCPDGRVRTLKRIAMTADTFFSIPASVSYQGKTVAGFVSVDTLNDPNNVVKFTPYAYRKHGDIFIRSFPTK